MKASIQISALATLATLPLLAYSFGQISLISLLTNLLLVPIVPVLMTAALLSWGLSFLWIGVGVGILKVVVEPLGGWFLFIVESLGSWRYAALYTPPFEAYWLIPTYLFLILLWRPYARPA